MYNDILNDFVIYLFALIEESIHVVPF